jgi:hypothetical protein
MVDQVLHMVHEFDPGLELKYNKFYIGLAEGGQPHNFIVMRSRKNTLVLTIRLKQSVDIESRLEESGIGAPEFDKRESGYRIRLGADDVTARQKILRELIEMAYREHEG